MESAELVVRITGDIDDIESKLDKTIKSFSSFGDKIEAGVAKAAKAGAALGAAVGVAAMVGFNGALENEQAGANLAASLGLAGAEAAKAGDIAGSLYASNFGESVAGAGDAVAAVIQGGLAGIEASSGEIETITSKVITFSEVFRQDMGESVSAVGAMLSNGLVPDANTAMDQLTTTMQRVPETLRGEIMSALTEYSPFFAQLGVDSEEAMAALARASAGGTIAIDKTGDALKELVIRVQDGSKLTGSAMDALGLDVDKIAAGFAAGGPAAANAMSEIVGALASVEDPVKQTQLGVALLGTPFEDLGAHAIPTLQALGTGLGEAAGAAQKMVDQVGGTNAAQLETFRRSMETNVNAVSEKAIGFLVQLPGPVQTVAATFAGMAPALAPLSPLIAAFGPSLLSASGSFLKMAGHAIASTVTTVVQVGIQVAKWAWLGAQSLLHAGKVALAWVIAMGPIALVVAAVLLAVGLIVANWEWVKETVGKVVGAIGDFLGNLIEKVVGFVQEWGILLLGPIGAIWKFRDQIGETIGKVVDFFIALPGRIIGAISSLAGRLWDSAWEAGSRLVNAITTKLDEVVDWVKGAPGRILEALGNLGSMLWDAGWKIMMGLKDGIVAGLEKVKDFVGGIAGKIISWKGPPEYDARLLVPAGMSIMDSLVDGLRAHEKRLAAQLAVTSGMLGTVGGDFSVAPPLAGPALSAPAGIDYDLLATKTAEAITRTLVPALAREMVALLRAEDASGDPMHVAREIAWRTGG